jgi:acetolactate synthase I/II/III large subunit
MSTSHRSGGEQVVDALVRSGIRHAFTVPGESFLGLLDALHGSPICVTATRHEAGAAFMAEAYSQLVGEPALCLATRAVGAANLSIGLHTARQDSTPLVAIVGQVPRRFRGREAFQEVDLVGTFGALCKGAVEIDDPSRLDVEVARMVTLSRSGRPGPVLISIPEDVLDVRLVPAPTTRLVRADVTAPGIAEPLDLPERPAPSPEEVEAVLERLAVARRPVIVAGVGILRSRAVNMLRAFAEASQIPVIAAWRRPDAFSNDLPLYLGMAGLGAARTVEPRLARADVVLAVGTRLSEITTFRYRVPGRGATLIHVDLEPGLGGDRTQPALAVRADARAFLRRALETLALAQRLEIPDLIPSDRLAASRAAELQRDRAAYLSAVTPPRHAPSAPVDPAVVVDALHRYLAPDGILTTDAGNFSGWAARYVQIRQGGRFIGPTSGAMGYGLPAAIGAALAAREMVVTAATAPSGAPAASTAPARVPDEPGEPEPLSADEGPPTPEPPPIEELGGTPAEPPPTDEQPPIEELGGTPAEPPPTDEQPPIEDRLAAQERPPAEGPLPADGPLPARDPASTYAAVAPPEAAERSISGEPDGPAGTAMDAEPAPATFRPAERRARQVVALAGDGGFAMLMAELETAVRERLRLAVLVFDNGMYGTIRMHQELAHPGRVVATDLGPIDVAEVARACGATGIRVERDEDVEPAVARALTDDAVTVVHLLVDPSYLSVDRRLPR